MKQKNSRKALIIVGYFLLLYCMLHLEFNGWKARTLFYPILWVSLTQLVYELFPRQFRIRDVAVADGWLVYPCGH